LRGTSQQQPTDAFRARLDKDQERNGGQPAACGSGDKQDAEAVEAGLLDEERTCGVPRKSNSEPPAKVLSPYTKPAMPNQAAMRGAEFPGGACLMSSPGSAGTRFSR